MVFVSLFSMEITKYEVDSKKCIGCTACINKCPVKAIKVESKIAVINTAKCVGCGKCAKICPVKAISKADSDSSKKKSDIDSNLMKKNISLEKSKP